METTHRDRTAIGGILALSATIFAFLLWLIYVNEGSGAGGDYVAYLPAVNAALNACCATCLVCGFIAIRSGRTLIHVTFMLTAVVFSALFFVSYIVYHSAHGDTPFTGTGPIRTVYFFVLISHILVTIFALPLILTTLFFAATRQFRRHRRIARLTLPLWLYVSITGVLIFVLLRNFG